MQKLLEAGNIVIFLSTHETQNTPLTTYYFNSCRSCVCVVASVSLPADNGQPLGAIEAESKPKQMVLMLHYQQQLYLGDGVTLDWL